MNLHNIEFELNKMKAETLGENGKKLEHLYNMMQDEKALNARRIKILARVEAKIADPACRRKNKKRMTELAERLNEKIAKSSSYLRQIEKRRQEIYKDVIMQREALGITDHSWIDKFYMKDKEPPANNS